MDGAYAVWCDRDSIKMADFRGFAAVRTLRSRAFGIDNGSRERDALTAFRLTAKRPICLAGAVRATARGLPHIAFPNGITDAYDHVRPSLRWVDA